MAQKYLAFLGTTNYQECVYCFRDSHIKTRFIQEALTSVLCRDWSEEDRILILTTAEAKEKNWDSHDGQIGLDERLSQLKLPCQHASIPIPKGKVVDELWVIFDTILQQLQEEDEIVFDITYGFRSLPMLALIIINYVKFVKHCSLLGVYYGAFEEQWEYQARSKTVAEKQEVRSSRQQTSPPEVPVFDLTPFVSLLDWTVGIDRFLTTGNATMLESLTEENVHQILRKTRGQHKQEAENLKQMTRALSLFSQNCSTCRGKELSTSALQVQKYVEQSLQASDELIKPLTPLLESMRNHFQCFESRQEITNIFQIVKWCREHNLVQQGITILEESIITDLCKKLNLNSDALDHRNKVSRLISHVAQQNPAQENMKKTGRPPKLFQEIQNHLPSGEFVNAFESLRNARNDINHAGYWRQYKPADRFKETFDKVLERFEDEIRKLGQ